MAPPVEPLSLSRCARCGGEFGCGARGPVPCWCSSLALDAALLAQLSTRFTQCLCRPCLLALSDDPSALAAASGPELDRPSAIG